MLVNEARIRQLINLIGQQHYSEQLKTLAADLERRLLEGKARLAQLSTSRNLEGEYTADDAPSDSLFRLNKAFVKGRRQ